MANILKGFPAAKALTAQLKEQCDNCKKEGIQPCLALVRLGNKEDDIAYEKGAIKRCQAAGIEIKQFILEDENELLDVIQNINEDSSIHGCLLFRPLENKELEKKACKLLSPAKDVDCMTSGSLAYVFSNSGDGFAPCTAESCIQLLDFYQIPVRSKRVAVIGRSLVIGKPVSILLQNKNATVTMCHTKTIDVAKICQESDIVVVAAGKAGLFTKEYAHPEQTVVDVGIHVDENGNLCGDVKFDEVEPVVKNITPVPGGVGSLTTAILAKHVIEAAIKQNKGN